MRRDRILVAVLALTAVLVVPSDAAANGGAYLDLDREHYLPGEHGVAETYVTVPERREAIFDRGPFYLFVVPEGETLAEGMPIPPAAIRVGTFEVEEERRQWELTASFVVPDVAGDHYALAVCNDPCTIAGFRESLSGVISIVATEREAELLDANARLSGSVFRLRREARRFERRADRLEEDLAFAVANGSADREELAGRVEALEADLAASERRATEAGSRVPVDPWMAAAIVALALVAGVLAYRRGRLVRARVDRGIGAPSGGSIHSARAHELDPR
jgi:hypothetical protein